MTREGQGYPCMWHDKMMMMMIYIYIYVCVCVSLQYFVICINIFINIYAYISSIFLKNVHIHARVHSHTHHQQQQDHECLNSTDSLVSDPYLSAITSDKSRRRHPVSLRADEVFTGRLPLTCLYVGVHRGKSLILSISCLCYLNCL